MREDEFEEICYKPVKDRLKEGKLDNFNRKDLKEIDAWVSNHLSQEKLGNHPQFPADQLQGKFLRLQFYLIKNQRKLMMEKAPVLYKALSMSLDFREYLGGLCMKEQKTLKGMADDLLSDIRRRGNPSNERQRELLKEQIRLICVHANQQYRDNKYEKALSITENLKATINKKLKATNKCQTVLGSIYYLEGKVLRNSGEYPDCEKSLSKSIDFYTDWTRDNHCPADLALASYKNAMSLGGIAWCKNMRGFNRDALNLINAARLLIHPTEWELDKAHLDMIYADISRTFYGEKSAELRDAIDIAQRSYDVFKNHPHERLRSRAAFTLALLNYYAGEYGTAEDFLEEVEAYSKQKHEARWYANAMILLARIKNKRKKFRVALEKLLPEAIQEAKRGKLDDRLVVAYIVKSESHLELNQQPEAIAALNEAQKENDRSGGSDKAVNSERNKGWIYLNFASAHLRGGDLAASKSYLDKWHELRGIKYQWLIDFAAAIEKKHTAAVPDFVIRKDVDSLRWHTHKVQLARWLSEMAKLQTNSDKREDLARKLKISTRSLGQLIGSSKKRKKRNAP